MALEHLRLATPEEILAIQETSDITPRTQVFALGEQKAVVRNVFEIDPIYTAGAKAGPLAKFVWGLEERLIGMGVDAYYFDMPIDDEAKEWRETVEHWGAGRTMPFATFRYKRVLVK